MVPREPALRIVECLLEHFPTTEPGKGGGAVQLDHFRPEGYTPRLCHSGVVFPWRWFACLCLVPSFAGPTEVMKSTVLELFVQWVLILCGKDITLTTSPDLFTLNFALVITHVIMSFTWSGRCKYSRQCPVLSCSSSFY